VTAPSDGRAAEQYLPENLRRYRDARGMSQAALAQAMSERGWPWHQPTVYKIESGKQPVGFGEVTDLAQILGVSAERLGMPGPEDAAVAFVELAAVILSERWHDLAEAAERLERARSAAARAVSRAEREQDKYPRALESAAELALALEQRTLESAVDAGIARYEANPPEET
jgi:transcriptional regulator with XRE-family HTH domain